MKKLINLFFVFGFYTLYFILNTSPVRAQSISLSIAPTLTELTIKPGRSAIFSYNFKNMGDPSIFKFRIEPFNLKDKTPIFFELNNSDIKLEEPVFIKNSASEQLYLRVAVPEETPEKDYYYNFIAESQPPPTQEGTANIRAKITVQSLLLITVTEAGQVEIKPKISLFEVIPKHKINLLDFKLNLFNSYEKVPVVLIIDNKGKNLIKPRGEITVRGPLWQTKIYDIKAQNVLAESQKRISLKLPGNFFGNYKLSTSVSFGEDTPALFASTSLVVLPIKLTFFATAGFILVLFLFLTKRNH
ncbi:hypothetical protein A2954_02665 [Candidatus Roizmanbacteria bacterium RIFCSPLOWO2_01_FULL_37_12]|uniref:Uncharacterized protein n=1 Tax=Candidatus Roizmanbacteria bacterium RIFCSPLOWO2_01_FULL_37_12 TaxID=1802056 RepID=A0A1F7IEZ2_9BACT|nr:MAG: hypothetical protein A2954_02665 [Candidatus Roizmanbacteria bacterium RIFCSPLOWO2_01_FULL_37_12]